MKVLLESPPSEVATAAPEPYRFELPDGLIGLPGYTDAELIPLPEQPPFLLLRLRGPRGTLSFIVLEPGGIIPAYEIEIFDADVDRISLTDASEAIILNVVTLQPRTPLEATVNLIGPIVINRQNGIGRQVVVANNTRYSARHRLMESAALSCV